MILDNYAAHEFFSQLLFGCNHHLLCSGTAIVGKSLGLSSWSASSFSNSWCIETCIGLGGYNHCRNRTLNQSTIHGFPRVLRWTCTRTAWHFALHFGLRAGRETISFHASLVATKHMPTRTLQQLLRSCWWEDVNRDVEVADQLYLSHYFTIFHLP